MDNLECNEVIKEIAVILKHTSKEVLDKVPEEVKRKFLEKSLGKTNFRYDNTKPLLEQKMRPETKAVIGILYEEYLCTTEEKQEYQKELIQFEMKQEKEKRQRYSPDNLFKRVKNK